MAKRSYTPDDDPIVKWFKSVWSWLVVPVAAGLLLLYFEYDKIPPGLVSTWNFISGSFSSTLAYFAADVTTKRWWYFVSSAAAALMVFALLRFLFLRVQRRYFPSEVRRTYREFRQLTAGKIHWTWKWSATGAPGEGDPYKIKPHCANCGRGLDKKIEVRTAQQIKQQLPTVNYFWCVECKEKIADVPNHEIKETIIHEATENYEDYPPE